MKKNISKVLGFLALIGIVSGCTAVASEVDLEVENNIEVEEIKQEVPIKLESMKRDTIESTYIAVGDVVPKNQVDIFVTGNGFIETFNAVSGAYIEKDDLIIELDNNDKNYTNYNATESQLRTVRDNLNEQITILKDSYEKQLILFNEGIISQFELDQIANQIPSLERQYENAQVSYKSQLSIISSNLNDVSESRRTYSPISGTIAAVYAKEGQAANNQLGLTIIDDSQIYVRAYVTGSLKKLLTIDDIVRVKLDGSDDAIEESRIVEIKDIPDPNSKLFEVLIEIMDQETYIIGDYAEVEFIIETYSAIMAPTEAVIRKGSEQYIIIYQNDKLKEVKIEPGKTKDEWIEVSNIYSLSEVVVRGQNQITSLEDFVIIE